ncbi:aspartate carbamoyltransferase catalytic subunit [bacterium]|nr:aspartate carbamoyltransferase catalytic subunit [bacterium]
MHPRCLLSITALPQADAEQLLLNAGRCVSWIQRGGQLKSSSLRGTSTLLLFAENSTRTRVSFELAGKLLGSDTINISSKGSSIEKGESLRDTAMTLAAMHFSCVVMRHEAADSAEHFARWYPGPVLNAGAGRGEHPTQALLDAFTLQRHGLLRPGAKLAIVGDLTHSRVARSNLALLARFGVEVTLVGPPNLTPSAWRVGAGLGPPAPGASEKAGQDPPLRWTPDLDSILPELDAVMLLRVQHERMAGGEMSTQDEYSKLYGMNRRRLGMLRSDALIMHPGPVNRGVEAGEDVFSDPRCVINEQVESGLALRAALLAWALERELDF